MIFVETDSDKIELLRDTINSKDEKAFISISESKSVYNGFYGFRPTILVLSEPEEEVIGIEKITSAIDNKFTNMFLSCSFLTMSYSFQRFFN